MKIRGDFLEIENASTCLNNKQKHASPNTATHKQM